MGWFWADAAPEAPKRAPVSSSPQPPPGCPMHRPEGGQPPSSLTPPAQCPRGNPSSGSTGNQSYLPQSVSSSATAEPASSSTLSKLNPLNYMPHFISQEKAPGQTVDLPVSREQSTIPRSDGLGTWEYPSPQQMYNAMARKGYTDTPTDAVTSMVAVHNFLNEGAWAEILEWERRFAAGIVEGAKLSLNGEGNARRQNGSVDPDSDPSAPMPELTTDWDEARHGPSPSLARFMGRPSDLTPRARIYQLLGRVYPEKFGGPPPFDRHDWYVMRYPNKPPKSVSAPGEAAPDTPAGDGKDGELIRYVIDYYEGPDDTADGESSFFLDVRPAIDSPDAAARRLVRWGGDIWWQALGGDSRNSNKEAKN